MLPWVPSYPKLLRFVLETGGLDALFVAYERDVMLRTRGYFNASEAAAQARTVYMKRPKSGAVFHRVECTPGPSLCCTREEAHTHLPFTSTTHPLTHLTPRKFTHHPSTTKPTPWRPTTNLDL